MSASTNLALPFLQSAQAQKHVTVNEGLLRLDALVQLALVSATVSAQPASPSDGAVYILPSGKTGAAWGGMANHALAYYRDGAWEEVAPREGWVGFVKDTDRFVAFSGSAWLDLPMLARAQAWTGANTFRTSTGGGAPLTIECDDAGADGPTLKLRHASASPAANDYIGYLQFVGKDSGGADEIFAYMFTRAISVTAGAEDADYQFWTIRSGSRAMRMSVGAGVVIGSPSGGDRGAGTLNATAIYDDNVLLTCGPVELLTTGGVDLARWDAIAEDVAPGRAARHEAMHAFARMAEDGFDPRDPENFCARLRADGAAPGLFTDKEWRELRAQDHKPDVGGALTRAFLAIDNLAVAFAGAVERLARLENRLSAHENGRAS